MAGVTGSNFEIPDRNSSGSTSAFHVGGYGNTTIGALDEALTANYAASSAAVYGEISYAFEKGNLTLEPFANASYVHLETDAFSETGGDAALSSDASSQDVTFVTLGLRASHAITFGATSADLIGSIGWQRGFGDLTALADLAFAGQPSFSVAGVAAASDSVLIGVGLDFEFGSGFDLSLAYNAQFSGSFQSHAVQLT